MHAWIGAALLGLALGPTSTAAADEATREMIEAYEAYAVYKMGRYEAARQRFQALAEKGNARGMLNLGHLYANGQGVARDPGLAFAWYERAARRGDPVAMYYAGRALELGQGVPVEIAAARRWYRQAAVAELPEAQYALGRSLLRDTGGGEGLAWIERAAAAGSLDAARFLRRGGESPVAGIDPDLAAAVRDALAAIDRAATQRNAAGVVHYLARDARIRVRLPADPVEQVLDRDGLRALWQATFDRVEHYGYQRETPTLVALADGVAVDSVIHETLGDGEGTVRLRLTERAEFVAVDGAVRVRRLSLLIQRSGSGVAGH